MKKLCSILSLIFSFAVTVQGQFVIDSTRFISGNTYGDEFFNAIPTNDKGFLILGDDYGNPGGIMPYFFDTVNSNVLIIKMDSSRYISWIKVYGGSQDDAANVAIQTPDGGYAILCGTGSDDGDITGYKGEGDIWLIRLDATGNLVWEKTYGSSLQDGPISIANTSDHGFIILGDTYGSDDDVPFHYGDWMTADWLVIKTDSIGNVQWSRDMGGTGDEYPGGAIFPVGNFYYLVGSSSSTDHDCTDTAWHSGVQTGYDYYVLKLDSTGNVLWDSSYGGGSDDDLNAALYDTRDSTLMLMGTTYSDNYMVTDYHGCEIGDMWTVKVSSTGTLLWEKTLGSIQEETGNSICAAPNGYMCYGMTFPGACRDSAIGDIGGQDCWIFNIDTTGNIISDKVFGGTDAEFSFCIIPDNEGYMAVSVSASNTFSEGTTNGRSYTGECGFISYLDYKPLSVNNIYVTAGTLAVYPNPAQNYINVLVPATVGKLHIINNIGQQFYTEDVGNSNTARTVAVNSWPPGVYLVVWQGIDGRMLTEKFIKE